MFTYLKLKKLSIFIFFFPMHIVFIYFNDELYTMYLQQKRVA